MTELKRNDLERLVKVETNTEQILSMLQTHAESHAIIDKKLSYHDREISSLVTLNKVVLSIGVPLVVATVVGVLKLLFST